MSQRNMAIAAAVLIVAAFLLGFVPGYLKGRELNNRLTTLQGQTQADGLALAIGRVYLQTNLKNYGLASQSSSLFFDRVRSLAAQGQAEPERQQFLNAALTQRDAVTSGLAKGDPAVLAPVQSLFQRALDLAATDK